MASKRRPRRRRRRDPDPSTSCTPVKSSRDARCCRCSAAAAQLHARHPARPIRVITYGELPATRTRAHPSRAARTLPRGAAAYPVQRSCSPSCSARTCCSPWSASTWCIRRLTRCTTTWRPAARSSASRRAAPRCSTCWPRAARASASTATTSTGIERALEKFLAGDFVASRARVERYRWANLALQYRAVIEDARRGADSHGRTPPIATVLDLAQHPCCRAQIRLPHARMCATSRFRPIVRVPCVRMATEPLPGETAGPARSAARSLADQPRPARALCRARRRALLARAAVAETRAAAALDHPAGAQAHPRAASASSTQRQAEGDRAFIEGIETMGFLATLVGLTSVERFIPLATHETERREVLAAKPEPRRTPHRRDHAADAGAGEFPRRTSDRARRPIGHARQRRVAARQMPARPPRPRSAPPRPVRGAAAPHSREPRRDAARAPRPSSPGRRRRPSRQAEHVVIADAVRLLGWGTPVARARRDDRAALRAARAVRDPPHPAHLPRTHRRHRDAPSRLAPAPRSGLQARNARGPRVCRRGLRDAPRPCAKSGAPTPRGTNPRALRSLAGAMIKTQNLTKNYHGLMAVDDLSFCGRARRSARLPRPQRRRQVHHHAHDRGLHHARPRGIGQHLRPRRRDRAAGRQGRARLSTRGRADLRRDDGARLPRFHRRPARARAAQHRKTRLDYVIGRLQLEPVLRADHRNPVEGLQAARRPRAGHRARSRRC